MGFDPRYPHEQTFRDWTVLLSHPEGAITGDDGCGLYHHDCRVLSRYDLLINDKKPSWVSSESIEADEWSASLAVELERGSAQGPALPQDALEIRLHRQVGQGMLERIEVSNHAMVGTTVSLALKLAADFADVLEVAANRRQVEGRTTATDSEPGTAADIRFHASKGEHMTERGLRIRDVSGALNVTARGSAVDVEGRFHLAPGETWQATLAFEPLVDGSWATADGLSGMSRDVAKEFKSWRRRRPRVTSSAPLLGHVFDLAADDLFSLRNRELEALAAGGAATDARAESWLVNAGMPRYTGLFGRDVLTAGWQSALVGTQFMRGALAATERLQATATDDWADAQPGKMIHELRRGPLAELRISAQAGYYGSQTTAAFFPTVLSELWHWTGDLDVVARHRSAAERAVEWAERYGDLDGDGFLEYERRSPVGLKNQGWKDSDEAIRYPDGSLVENPIATVEEQAFHYLALVRMAEICAALDDDQAAERYLDHARSLRKRWHEAFWLPQAGFYAMALDARKQPVATIGSNAGHALAAGIVPSEHARAVADRLLAPDMFSGWGVRTLSADHPSYNPWAYHLGTVWPVENATLALGMKRYGLDDQVGRLAEAFLAAAQRLPGMRLPELMGGQARAEIALPVAYPDACCPQAWSASATVQMVQIMLGLYPFAPLRVLAVVRPHLPGGIDELTVHHVRVGKARVSLRFTRRPDGSAAHEVIARRGSLLVVDAPPPDAVERRDIREVVAAALLAHAPGRLARAGRIALGMID